MNVQEVMRLCSCGIGSRLKETVISVMRQPSEVVYIKKQYNLFMFHLYNLFLYQFAFKNCVLRKTAFQAVSAI
ncbi:MAG: hypothetical protein BWK80_03135 [Desulfobacteraceae bacterium IS3]|nr:MAG: hypothetical protein BWK80_03135 [Desulfobacteraceae bacterium IS3]